MEQYVNLVFTFHNVSINSDYTVSADFNTDEFTFHNVSINSLHGIQVYYLRPSIYIP